MNDVHRDLTELALWAHQRDLVDLRPLASGIEFSIYSATDLAGAPVVLRVPLGERFQSNANDPKVDTRALLVWEERVTRQLTAIGLPVAEPVELFLGPTDVLVSRYVPDDGSGVDPARLGALLARLHQGPIPVGAPVAAEGLPPGRLLPRRITHRWREVAALLPDLPATPDERQLARLLDGRPTGSLLHLDVRAANLRCVRGEVLALLDWSNALVGDPALELARLTEFAAIPENGLDITRILAGYGQLPGVEHPSFLVYRLDAAVMLAVVFLSEAPDEVLGAHAIDRLLRVREELAAHLM